MNFYRELKEEIVGYEGRHDDLIYLAPEFYRLLTTHLDDPRLTAPAGHRRLRHRLLHSAG